MLDLHITKLLFNYLGHHNWQKNWSFWSGLSQKIFMKNRFLAMSLAGKCEINFSLIGRLQFGDTDWWMCFRKLVELEPPITFIKTLCNFRVSTPCQPTATEAFIPISGTSANIHKRHFMDNKSLTCLMCTFVFFHTKMLCLRELGRCTNEFEFMNI